MRVALYWTPELADPLAASGHSWLGRDPERGVIVAQPAIAGLAEATAAARVYGFHATLRPPIHLATGWEDFMATARALAAGLAPFDLPPLMVDDLSGYLVLREARACSELQGLADACVRTTDVHRLPPSASELARRRRHGLTAEEEAMLARWGYPYVMQHWRFHMTLSRRLQADEMSRLRPAADAHFAAAFGHPRRVCELAVFTQADDGPDGATAPFLIAERLQIGGDAD